MPERRLRAGRGWLLLSGGFLPRDVRVMRQVVEEVWYALFFSLVQVSDQALAVCQQVAASTAWVPRAWLDELLNCCKGSTVSTGPFALQ